jgi:cytochrome o ubiquinol oxidase subunit 2
MKNKLSDYHCMRTVVRMSLPCILLALTGCRAGVLDPQGQIAASERLVLLDATLTMLVVVVPVILLTVAFGWWFRAGNARATYRPSWAYSGQLEVVVWAVPALVVMFLGGMAWVATHELDPPRPIKSEVQPIDIQVVSLDWKWLFIYPNQGVATVNQLVVPAGTPVRLRLTSATVMNSFFVPQLAGQIYTMHGMTTRLNLMADHPGTYKGLSSQFSGDGFSDMRFDVVAKSPSDFAVWTQATQARSDRLDAAAYTSLLQPSSAVPSYAYGRIAPGLFDTVAAGNLPQAPAPIATTTRFDF